MGGVHVCMCLMCLCALTITVCVCGHSRPMSWNCSSNRTGPILRTWGTRVDVRGLTESKGLRPGPTQTLTYCVCCLHHCVLENKSFGGDTGSKGYPWAPTQTRVFGSHLMFVFSLGSCWNDTVSLTIFLLNFFSPMSSPCVLFEAVPSPEKQSRWPIMWGVNIWGGGINLSVSCWRQKKEAVDKRQASRVRAQPSLLFCFFF